MTEVNMNQFLNGKFSNGNGVLQLLPGMSDEMLLFSIKRAIDISEGQPFTVIPPVIPRQPDNVVASADASVAFAYKQAPRWLAECPHCEREAIVTEDDCQSGAIFTATCCHCNNTFEARAD